MGKKTGRMLRTAMILFLAALFISGCGKRGCMDRDSENYEPSAKVDCSCCYYYGKIYIWYSSQYYSNNLHDVTAMSFYADGELISKTTKNPMFVGNYYEQQFYAIYYPPEYENVMVISLGGASQKTCHITVTDQDNATLLSRDVVVKANYIQDVQIGT